jgi:cobalt-zinc-cadmium efflux system protein
MYHSHSLGCPIDCNHGHIADRTVVKSRKLWIALVLISCFALTELVVGLFSHSLALLAESGHMVSDGLALGLALLANWIAQFPASSQATFGYRRVEILAALANGIGLISVATWIAWESIARLQAPSTEILSLPMLLTAIAALGVNSLNAFLLHDHSHQDLNLRGAFLHLVADAVSSVGVILAAIAVWTLHWNWADGVISLGVAGLIALSAIPLIRQSLHILLEKTPAHLDLRQIQLHLEEFEPVVAVDKLRLWTIALGQETLTAHLTVNLNQVEERDRLLYQIQASLQQRFGIQEVFLQVTAPLLPQLTNLSQPGILGLVCWSVSEIPSGTQQSAENL